MKFREFQHQPVKPDTYEASMALNQLLKIGKHAIKIHNMIDDAAEMEAWVAKKIDLAGDYVKKVHGYMQGEKAGLYDDGGMTEDANNLETAYKQIAMLANNVRKEPTDADDQMDVADDVARPITKILSTIMDYDKGEQMPDGSASKTTYVDMYKKLGMLANKGAETNDPKVAPLLFKMMSSIYDMDKVSEGSIQEDAGEKIANMAQNMTKDEFMSNADELGLTPKEAAEYYEKMQGGAHAGKFEDAGNIGNEIAKMYDTAYEYINDSSDNPSDIESDYKFGYNDDDSMEAEDLAAAFRKDLKTGMALQKQLQAQREKEGREGDWDPFNPESMYHNELKALMSKAKGESVSEDAGEGHMSKSTLYHTAKYAIELMDMINKGDDLEGWVQSKLNKAADYLQGVHNYEEYQKLNPYREELDSNTLNRHAQVIQKNIDEILARETSLDDVDTKPGMMRILAKRVNEVEKEIAKKTRKKTDESGILYRAGVKKYGKAGMKAIQSAAAKGANHQEIGKIKDKHLKDDEDLEEGIKDWAKNLAAAGVIVGAVAGMGSIQNAIDNSVPAVKAMNTAYEMAIDSGNTELADMIKQDMSAVKVRLDSGRDLNFVKSMQDKYSKFIKTESLAYENKLEILLAQKM